MTEREPHAGRWALDTVRRCSLREVRALIAARASSPTLKRICQARLELPITEWHQLLKDAGVRTRFGPGRPVDVTPEQIAKL